MSGLLKHRFYQRIVAVRENKERYAAAETQIAQAALVRNLGPGQRFSYWSSYQPTVDEDE